MLPLPASQAALLCPGLQAHNLQHGPGELFYAFSALFEKTRKFFLCHLQLFLSLKKKKEKKSVTYVSPGEREWLPTPVFWPGEFHGLRSPWGRKESDFHSLSHTYA